MNYTIIRLIDNVVGYFLVCVFLFGTYTNIHLYSNGNLLVPYFISGVSGIILLLKNHRCMRLSQLKAILILMLIVSFSVLFKGFDHFVFERIKGAVQIFYSLILAYAFFIEVERWERNKVARLFYYCCLVIIVGCAFENYTNFKVLSDGFRDYVYPVGVYEAFERDINIFGRERPKLFTSEPSYVAMFLLFSMTIWFALSEGLGKYIGVLVMGLLGSLLIGSPITILIVPISLITIVFLEKQGLILFLRKMTRTKIFGYLFFLVLLLFFLGYLLFEVFSLRLASVSLGEGSVIARLVLPPRITFEVLRDYPFWGSGIAAKEMVVDAVFFYLKNEYGLSYLVSSKQVLNSMTNIFWLHWMYLGLLGGGLMLLGLSNLMNTLKVRYKWYCAFVTLVFSQTMGGYVGLRFWVFVFGIFLCAKKRFWQHD